MTIGAYRDAVQCHDIIIYYFSNWAKDEHTSTCHEGNAIYHFASLALRMEVLNIVIQEDFDVVLW